MAEALESRVSDASIDFWKFLFRPPWPDAAEGRWLVPTDAPQTGRARIQNSCIYIYIYILYIYIYIYILVIYIYITNIYIYIYIY